MFLPLNYKKMKLYHYPHCPFCQRVRLFLAFKGIEYESIVLSYDDNETSASLGLPTMLPIMDFGDGRVMNESLEIIRMIEQVQPYPIGFVGPVESKIQWASMAAVNIPRYFDLLIPWYPDHYRSEFGAFPEGEKYYRESKEAKRGKTFEALKEERVEIFETAVRPHLSEIIDKVEDEYFIMGPTFSVADCVLAADLSGLRIVPDIAVPIEITHYIERVEKHCRLRLLESS